MPVDPKTGKEYPYTDEGIAQHKKDTEISGFKMRSGNAAPFKELGSSPAKDTKVAKEGGELSKFDTAHNARHESGEMTKDHIVDNDVRARLREEQAEAEMNDSDEE